MTTGLDFLLPYLSKKIFWILLVVISVHLPIKGQAADLRTVHSIKSDKIGSPSLPTNKKSTEISYIVGPEDVLAIDVYDNPDLKGEYTVSTDGDIVFPLVGQVKVSGKTLADIKNKLTRLLEKDYLFNPIVSVTVSKYLSKKVKIMGNVGKPGVYYLDRTTRLFDLLTKAEGISRQLEGGAVMSGQKVHIMRAAPGSDKITTYYIELHQLLVEGRDEANIHLQPDDVIYIPDTSVFHVIGEVKKTGSFPFEKGITLLKAIALAGGFTEKGSFDNAVIKRASSGRLKEIKGELGTVLQKDDTIFIPEVGIFHVVGEVKNPGAFSHEPHLTLLKAIAMAGGATQKAAPKNSVIKRLKKGKIEKIEAAMDSLILPDDIIEVPLSFW